MCHCSSPPGGCSSASSASASSHWGEVNVFQRALSCPALKSHTLALFPKMFHFLTLMAQYWRWKGEGYDENFDMLI